MGEVPLYRFKRYHVPIAVMQLLEEHHRLFAQAFLDADPPKTCAPPAARLEQRVFFFFITLTPRVE